MAFVEDQQQQTSFKHFCRICKKGFMCGRALGGHMRAHGIGDESPNIDDDDDDPASDLEDRGNAPPNKRMYALRTNPNRLKSCRSCENCGKEFVSWKSFLEHGKCNSSDDAESLVSSPPSEDEGEEQRRRCQWSKRKRSYRAKVGSFTSEDDDFAATCLVMLSNARVDEQEESCASASKEADVPLRMVPYVSTVRSEYHHHQDHHHNKDKGVVASKGIGLFECKACKKVFNSHQALGGHRASHKKVKGCFAARLDLAGGDGSQDDDITTAHEEFFPTQKSTNSSNFRAAATASGSSSRRKSKVHECTICHRIFSSGQALGGHKRCHWITSNSPETSSLARFGQIQDQMDHTRYQRPKFGSVDLNAPVPGNNNDLAGIRRDPKNPLSFEVSTDIKLETWPVKKNEDDGDDNNSVDKNNAKNSKNDDVVKDDNTSIQDNADDEADSKVKLAKLSELKDMNVSNVSSSWLQVGIGSSTDVASDP